MNYTTKRLEEFEEEFIMRNYEADAHTEDVHITDRPEDIKHFLTETINQVKEQLSLESDLISPLIPDTIDGLDTSGAYSVGKKRGYSEAQIDLEELKKNI